MNIRNYQKEDDNRLVKLVVGFQNYITTVDRDELIKNFESEADARKYLDKLLKDIEEMEGFLFVAEENGQIVGFVHGIIERYKEENTFYSLTHKLGDIGWIGVIYVTTENRCKGIAKSLFEKAQEFIRSKGCKKIKLLVLRDNKNAVELYEKLGFETHDLEMSLDI